MAIDFLTEDQKQNYGCFFKPPSDEDMACFFHLDDTDLELSRKKRGNHNRLGFALQLTTARYLGVMLSDPKEIPDEVIVFVAKQLDITDYTILIHYSVREPTKIEHASQIKQHFGFSDFNDFPWRFRLTRWLYVRVWLGNDRPSVLFDIAVSWLLSHKILLPGMSTLVRLIIQIRERVSSRLWSALTGMVKDPQKQKLLSTLNINTGSIITNFEWFKKGPYTISSSSLIESLRRYNKIKELGIAELGLNHIPPVKLDNLARYAINSTAYKIGRMPDNRKIATLIAFIHSIEKTALDDLLDVFDLLLSDISSTAKLKGKKQRLRTLKDLDKAALYLASIYSKLILKIDHPEELAELLQNERISQSVETINDLARPEHDDYHKEKIEQYKKVRRFLPKILQEIDFKCGPAGEAVMAGIHYLIEMENDRSIKIEDAPTDFVTKSWQKLVFENDEKICVRGYTLCLIDRLQDNLRRRDIYVEASSRWCDTRTKLLDDNEWQIAKPKICQVLGHTSSAEITFASLSDQLDEAYKTTINNFENNPLVKVDHSKPKPSLTITNIDAKDETASLIDLRKRTTELLPRIALTELLLEINAHTNFIKEFTHISESVSKAKDIDISICAVLIAEACNIGIEPLVNSENPALTRHRLNWVKQNYVRTDTLIKANARLVDFQSSISLVKEWGGGDVASADGMRFVTPIKTINSGPNRKYFGAYKGITWYNFVSDQFSGFHGIVIPGTLRDSMFVLEGILEQETSLKPTEVMVDTAGSSDMVFGLFWLLGYQFSPRLADAGESSFWRIDTNANYGVLDNIAKHKINQQIITTHWNDMLRIAGSLKLGKVKASELIRTLLKSDKPSSLAKAIIELGRINRTIYLLNYIDNEEYRRRILIQLNKGEARHAVARAICHGQRGEIRKRYREGQEDQLGALGFVTNAIVLWNSIYMDATISHLRSNGTEVSSEDMARLSPLQFKHINFLGQYHFKLSERISSGQLRPLREAD